MKHLSFNKFKCYLEQQGYYIEYKDDHSDALQFVMYFFSKDGQKNKYFVNVLTDRNGVGDEIICISYGYGSFYVGGINKVKVDYRKNFWKQFIVCG